MDLPLGFFKQRIWAPLHSIWNCAIELTLDDKIHHASTALLTTPIIVYYLPIKLTTAALFFLSGLPGMIDYFTLWCVKMGWVASQRQKKNYVTICVWMRSPGTVVIAFLSIQGLVVSSTKLPLWPTLWTAGLAFVNGQYYMHLTLRDFYTKRLSASQQSRKS